MTLITTIMYHIYIVIIVNLQCCTQSYLKHRRQNKVLKEWSVSSFEQASAFGLYI